MTGVSKKQILKRIKDFPGIEFVDGEYRVVYGTRYPMARRDRIQGIDDRRRVLLKAIDQNKYIDATVLGIYQGEFEAILGDLISANLIYENDSDNYYGANKYSSRSGVTMLLKKRRREANAELARAVATITGTFAGAVISQIN